VESRVFAVKTLLFKVAIRVIKKCEVSELMSYCYRSFLFLGAVETLWCQIGWLGGWVIVSNAFLSNKISRTTVDVKLKLCM